MHPALTNTALRLLGGMVILGLALGGCVPFGASGGSANGTNRPISSGPVTCAEGIAAAGAPVGPSAGDEPDFALYGFPRVVASEQFTPGRELRIRAERIEATIPPDFYTDPVRFEILVGDEQVWQRCMSDDLIVVAPYAYRVTDPASGSRVGRYDRPVAAVITDARIGAGAIFWTTTPAAPPVVEPASTQPRVESNTVQVNNPNARIGWFTTVPKR